MKENNYLKERGISYLPYCSTQSFIPLSKKLHEYVEESNFFFSFLSFCQMLEGDILEFRSIFLVKIYTVAGEMDEKKKERLFFIKKNFIVEMLKKLHQLFIQEFYFLILHINSH